MPGAVVTKVQFLRQLQLFKRAAIAVFVVAIVAAGVFLLLVVFGFWTALCGCFDFVELFHQLVALLCSGVQLSGNVVALRLELDILLDCSVEFYAEARESLVRFVHLRHITSKERAVHATKYCLGKRATKIAVRTARRVVHDCGTAVRVQQ